MQRIDANGLLVLLVELCCNFLYLCRMRKYIENIAFLNNGIALRKDYFAFSYNGTNQGIFIKMEAADFFADTAGMIFNINIENIYIARFERIQLDGINFRSRASGASVVP